MGIKKRIAHLERTNPDSTYRLFVKEVGAPGRDADGWLPGDEEAAAVAEAQGNPVTIISISERKASEANLGN